MNSSSGALRRLVIRLSAIVLGIGSAVAQSDEPDPLPEDVLLLPEMQELLDELRPDAWQTMAGVSAAWGRRDNPGLSTLEAKAANFGQLRVEGFARRQTTHFEVRAMVDGQQRWYGDHPVVDDDALWFGRGEVRWRPWTWWEWIPSVQGYWQDQVLDLTEDIGMRTVAPVQVIGGDVGLATRLQLPVGFALEGRVRGLRADYRWVPEDYVAVEGRGELSWQKWSWLTLGVSRVETTRDYDFRGEATIGGRIVPDTLLSFEQTGEEARAQVRFDLGGSWRIEGRMSDFTNRDSAAGFYDYDRDRWSAAMEWRRGAWEVQGRYERSEASYLVQTVGAGLTPDPREQQDTLWEVELRRSFGEHWEGVARYEFDESLSNDLDSSYTDRTMWVGVGYLF